jgi:hypothetical protein
VAILPSRFIFASISILSHFSSLNLRSMPRFLDIHFSYFELNLNLIMFESDDYRLILLSLMELLLEPLFLAVHPLVIFTIFSLFSNLFNRHNCCCYSFNQSLEVFHARK